MHDYQKILNEIHAAGAELVAVSPVTPDNSLDMVQKNALEFVVLSDTGNKVAREYGVVYDLPEGIRMFYQKGGMLDLSTYNDNDALELPLTVTYVIDTGGIVRYAWIDADYRKRAETAEVLDQVRKLGQGR